MGMSGGLGSAPLLSFSGSSQGSPHGVSRRVVRLLTQQLRALRSSVPKERK